MKLFKPNLTIKELQRIFSKINIHSNGCWIWTGAIIKNRGYGVFNLRGKTHSVHRLLFAHYYSGIPIGNKTGKNVLDHIKCDTVNCVNPEHLILTSQKKNVLRGNSPMAINARKTHCIKGHKLPDKPNEIWGKNKKGRRCVICRRINRMKRYYKEKNN